MDLNSYIKASALGYAITFLLLVGLICSGVLFIASVNKRLERNYSVDEHLVFDNYFALLYGSKSTELGRFLLPHPAGDTSEVFVKLWGAFKVVEASTFHLKKKISRSSLFGESYKDSLLALFLANSNDALKVCGSTRLEGNISLSEQGVERGYITGKEYSGKQLFYGKRTVSSSILPPLRKQFANLSLASFSKDAQLLNWNGKDSIFSFKEKTTLISSVQPIYLQARLEGNLIIHSFDSIVVAPNARLENVILIAPKIYFQAGFRGSLQAIAHERIICEQHVSLRYPSVLILNELKQNSGLSKREIVLKEKSKVVGGILLVSQSPDFRRPIELSIFNSLVAGFVYNTGKTALQGTVIGSIYTQQFGVRAGGGEYSNHLIDARISSWAMPKGFVYPTWIESEVNRKSEIIACY